MICIIATEEAHPIICRLKQHNIMRMRTLLLISSGLLTLSSVATAAVPERTTHVTSKGALRQMRAAHQQVPDARVQIPVAKEAPANTIEVPFTHDLGKGGTEVKNYTDINVNGDNRKW